jgi:hypothetical protein
LAVLCDAAVKAGDLQLIWNESDKSVTGYTVYQVSGGSHTRLGTASGTARYYLVKRPSGGYANMCFAVEADVGSQASADSAQYCYAPGAAATNVSLKPSHASTYVSVTWSYYQCLPSEVFKAANRDFGSAFTMFFPWLLNDKEARSHGPIKDGVFAGNETALWKNQPHCKLGLGYDYIQAAQIQAFADLDFGLDLGTLANHKLYSATLTLEPSQSVILASGKVTLSRGHWCETYIGFSNGSGPPNIPSALAFSVPTIPRGQAKGAASLNITPFVSAFVYAWTYHHITNTFGIGTTAPTGRNLQGYLAPTASYVCLTKFSNPSLQLVYF